MKDLEPVDLDQCQAEIREPHGPFRLGPDPGYVRCKARPTRVATEARPGSDGRRGAMSLCAACTEAMLKKLGADYAVMESAYAYRERALAAKVALTQLARDEDDGNH